MQPAPDLRDPRTILSNISTLRTGNDWEGVARFAASIPDPFGREWLPVVDEVAFALGHLHRTDPATSLLEQAYTLEPTARRASSLAYLWYDALWASKRRRQDVGQPVRDREKDRQGFTRWMVEALRLDPRSVKDLYRLGVYESQIENQRDAAALRAFQSAIDSYRQMSEEIRDRRHDLAKPYRKSLYAGARSAFRIQQLVTSRRLIFDCIREDRSPEFVDGLFKMFLAGKVCFAQGQHDHAERAFRLALDARGPRERDFVHAALADLARSASRLSDGAQWIESHIPPHRRKSYVWRLLGDIRADMGQDKEALIAYENALRRDRGGRHLTLFRMGRLHLKAGRLGRAEADFDRATGFRKSRYLAEHRDSLLGLIEVARRKGEDTRIPSLRARLDETSSTSELDPSLDDEESTDAIPA